MLKIKKNVVVKKGLLVLAMLLLVLTAVSCATSPTNTEAGADETAVNPARNRQLFSRAAQTGDETAVDNPEEDDDAYDGDYDDSDYDEEYVDWFVVAAEAIGMDEDALWEALMEGKSIADLAEDSGAVVNAIVAAETEWINGLVDAEDITAEEAAEWIAELDDEAQEFVDDTSWALWEGSDWFVVAAEAIGVEEDALWEAESIAAVAEANGVDTQTVIEAIVAAETAWLDELVAADELTVEEAAEWTAELDEEVSSFVEESWEYDEFGDVEGVDWFIVAAEAIGVEEDALWEAESIAAVAEANGVDAQTVIEAITAAETAWLDELVADGELTAEEAAEWTAELGEEINSFVQESWEFDEFDDFEGVDWFVISADMLNTDEDGLWDALMEGQSIAELAAAQGVETQTVHDAIVDAENASIAELIASGDITQEEADEWAAETAVYVDEFLQDASWALWEGVDWYAIAQEALGMDEDAMWEALDNGQSLAELAAAQGVDAQTIVEAVVAAEAEWINEMVASGELDQAEADEWTSELDEEVDFFLNEKWEYETE